MRPTSSIRSISRVRSLAALERDPRGERLALGGRSTPRPRRSRIAADSCRATSTPEDPRRRARGASAPAAARAAGCVLVEGARHQAGAAELDQQAARDRHRPRRQLAGQALLEAPARLAAQPEGEGGVEDRRAVEGRRLQQHPGACPAETSANSAPKMPAITAGRSASQIASIEGSRRALDAVEGHDRLALGRAAHDDPPARPAGRGRRRAGAAR